MASRSDLASRFLAPGYGVALLFIVLPVLDTFSQVWPFAPGNPSWRYGTVGVGANYLISFVFGLGLACLIAALGGHRRTLRVLALVSGLAALVLLLASVSFVLDALEVRPGVPRDNPNTLWLFDVGAAKAVFKYGVNALALAALALAGRRAWRAAPNSAAEPPVLVGRRSTPAQ